MRLVKFCDMVGLPEIRAEQIGEATLITDNTVLITYVAKQRGSAELEAVGHVFWDIANYRAAQRIWREVRSAIEQQHAIVQTGGALLLEPMPLFRAH